MMPGESKIDGWFEQLTEDLSQFSYAAEQLLEGEDNSVDKNLLFTAMVSHQRIKNGITNLNKYDLDEYQKYYDRILYHLKEAQNQYYKNIESTIFTEKIQTIINIDFFNGLQILEQKLIFIRKEYLGYKILRPKEEIDEDYTSELYNFVLEFNEYALISQEIDSQPELQSDKKEYIQMFEDLKRKFIQSYFRYFSFIGPAWKNIQQREYDWQIDWLIKNPQEYKPDTELFDDDIKKITRFGKPTIEDEINGCDFSQEKTIRLATDELPENENENVWAHVKSCKVCMELYSDVLLVEQSSFEEDEEMSVPPVKAAIIAFPSSRTLFKYAASIVLLFIVVGGYDKFLKFDPQFNLVKGYNQSKSISTDDIPIFVTKKKNTVKNSYQPIIHIDQTKDRWVYLLGIDSILKDGFQKIYQGQVESKKGPLKIKLSDDMLTNQSPIGGPAGYFLVLSKKAIPDIDDRMAEIKIFIKQNLTKDGFYDFGKVKRKIETDFPKSRIETISILRSS